MAAAPRTPPSAPQVDPVASPPPLLAPPAAILSSPPSLATPIPASLNPSKDTPTPDQPPPPASVPSPAPAPAFNLTASPSSSPPRPLLPATISSSSSSPPSGRHRIPSFPPPQASRISIMSTLSAASESFHAQFASSLPYTQVRDFAYPALHPLHYGPSISSGLSTPAGGSQRGSQYLESTGPTGTWYTSGGSGYRRLSDPAHPSFDTQGAVGWGESSLARQRSGNQPPPLNFSDGPPWSEDEDLQSPVVVSKHRKHKSSAAHLQTHHSRGQSKNVISTPTVGVGQDLLHQDEAARDWDGRRKSVIENGMAPGGDYYTTRSGRRTDLAGGEPGGELYHHPVEETEYDHTDDDPGYYHSSNQQYVYSDEDGHEYDDEDDEEVDEEDSRFSRDYQFTIASPDEEMHGKAVALFDFIRENENELPLVEGQVVWVSYRHGMGWLVAEDPKTGESGLIPEEYVRLFRDLYTTTSSSSSRPTSSAITSSSLNHTDPASTTSSSTFQHHQHHHHHHQPPIISTFSTSSQDVHPYPYQIHHPHHSHSHHHHHLHHHHQPLRAKSTPDLLSTLDSGGGGEGENTPTLGTHREKERIASLQREQDRAVAEESSTPRGGGGGKDILAAATAAAAAAAGSATVGINRNGNGNNVERERDKNRDRNMDGLGGEERELFFNAPEKKAAAQQIHTLSLAEEKVKEKKKEKIETTSRNGEAGGIGIR